MVEISNRTLAILMVVAILVSLGGLFLSLDRLSKLQAGVPPGITTFATTGAGRANVSVAPTISIILDDNTINFGTCTLTAGGYDLYLESNYTCLNKPSCNAMNITSASTGGKCENSDSAPANISIRNDGNVDVNVSVATTSNSTSLFSALDNTRKYFGYRTINFTPASGVAACGIGWNIAQGPALSLAYNSTDYYHWTEFQKDSSARSYRVCANLTYPGNQGATANTTVYFQVRMRVPGTESVGEKNASLVFTGVTAVVTDTNADIPATGNLAYQNP